jgi:hypothetical protein
VDDVAEGPDPVAEMFARSAPEESDDGHVADAAALPLAAVAGQSAGEPTQHVAQSAVRLRPHQKVRKRRNADAIRRKWPWKFINLSNLIQFDLK